MNWIIPNFDQQILYAVKEISRWAAENFLTLLIIGNILQWLKNQALKTPSVIDDKIISVLIYFFSFAWLKKLTQKPEEPKPEVR